MDRNLRIRMLLEAGDKVSRPLRDIASGSGRASRSLQQTRDQLAALNRAQSDLASFRTLKNDLRGTEQQLGLARTRVAELARQMQAAENPSRKLARDFDAAKRAAAALKSQAEGQSAELQRLRDRMREAGLGAGGLVQHERNLRQAVARTNDQLEEQSRRLQQSSDRARRMGAARERFGAMQGTAAGMAASGFSAIETGRAIGAPLVGAVVAAQQFQSGMTDIAQKADLTRAQAEKMGEGLLVAARAANQLPENLQQGVDVLSGFGLNPAKATEMIAPIGRAATAYKAEISDLAAASFANLDNLKVPIEQTGRAIDVMAQAGKAGAFEMKDMAQYFPTLSAGYQALGQKGVGAVADLSAALQIARKGAGDAATAAGNVSNVLQKISSPGTVKAFGKMGVDLPKALKKLYAEGKTPLEAIAELTNKTLGGDMSKLGNLFEDAQVQQGLRPLIANMEEYRRIRAEALSAGGTTDRDFAERMKDSAEQTKRLQVSGTALAVTLGAALLPTVNAVLERANAFTDRVSKWTAANPGLSRSIAVGAAAFAALFLVLGGGAILIAGLVAPFAALSATATLLGVGMLPLIGIVGGVVLGVVALGAAAYAIYANWGAISTWFAGLWESIKSATWTAIQFVGRLLLNFSPVGLMIQGFMALLAWMRGPLGQQMIAAGGDIVRGIITGISAMLGQLKATVMGAASAAANWFKSKLGIHSPSRVFASFGGFMMQGLDQGLAREQDAPVDRVDGLTARLANAVATGTAALAIGAGSAGPAAAVPSAGPVAAAAAPIAAPAPIGPITIVIQQQPGQSGQDLARMVRDELEKLTRGGAGAGRRTSMADRPDGDDL
ncbi:phage tail tape measure protein [Sphingomonas pituitosa]|uniref:phage tail tape measure protein n=1 Tax=Sphingomonas pituitosa TaxID=99597 RepID=UPI000B280D7B|nr:phage tail tape measure protein [Sphingomonas pituitosa]